MVDGDNIIALPLLVIFFCIKALQNLSIAQNPSHYVVWFYVICPPAFEGITKAY